MSESFTKHFLSAIVCQAPHWAEGIERIMSQSLLSRSFQPRGRDRDVTQKRTIQRDVSNFVETLGTAPVSLRGSGKGIREEARVTLDLRVFLETKN